MTPPAPRADTLDMHAADVAKFSADIGYLQKTVDDHVRDDKEIQALLFAEVNTLKRLVWVQIGGIAVLAWMVGVVGHDIMKYLK